MGNFFAGEEEVGKASRPKLFDTEEEALLLRIFNDSCKSSRTLEELFSGYCRNKHLSSFGKHLLDAKLEDFPSFLELCGLLVRDTPTCTMTTVLTALQKCAAQDHKEKGVEVKVSSLFVLFLLEISQTHNSKADANPMEKEEEGDIESMARKVVEFIASSTSTSDSDNDAILSWVYDIFPHAPALLQAHFHQALHLPHNASSRPFISPYLADTDTVDSNTKTTSGNRSSRITDLDVLPLALYSKEVQGEWHLLYSTDQHGFDFLNLKDACIGYGGGTVIIITAKARHLPNSSDNNDGNGNVAVAAHSSGKIAPRVFGAYNAAGWKDDRQSYSTTINGEGFVFVLDPCLRIMRSGHSCQYLNTKSFDRTQHGMGLGCSSSGITDKSAFAIFLPTTLENCMAFGKLFEIDSLNMYATGGRNAVQAGLAGQAVNRQIAAVALERARTVDKAAFFNSEFDREMFLGKTFAHSSDVKNRDY